MSERKILIISHNPMSNSDNMGKTIKNIFSNFNKDELCQIYFHDGDLDFSVCNKYFCFNEVLMMKSIFNRKMNPGKEVYFDTIQDGKGEHKKTLKNKIYQYGRKRTDFIYCLRNLIWNLGKWDCENLEKWIQKEKPSCIFFFAGDYYFLFKIVMKLSKKYKIPFYSYHVDEYFFNKKSKQKIGIDAIFYKKNFTKLFQSASMNFCISELMQKEYQSYFNKQTELLMNTSKISLQAKEMNKEVLYMNYFGNLSYNRWKVISQLSSLISQLNTIYSRKIIFNVYSGEKNKKILDPLIANNDVNFKGSISSNEVYEKMIESDILLHVESFARENIFSVKHSISTKIPDLLASQRIILAIGPEEVESINYIKRNNAGIVINSNDDNIILKKLKSLYEQNNYDALKYNAKELFNRNHTDEHIRQVLNKYLK